MLGNPLRTCWKQNDNFMGTHWEQQKIQHHHHPSPTLTKPCFFYGPSLLVSQLV